MYVARVAMGADPQQTLRAFREAEAYDGPSLVIAYSHCIAHGYDMRDGLDQQYRAVASGHWPLIRYDPVARAAGGNPFLLDSPRPRMPLADYRKGELRFRALANADPAEAERLLGLAQQAADLRWQTYEEMATRSARDFPRRRPQGPLMELSTELHGPCPAQPARGVGVAAVLHRSTASGAWRTPASARSSCSRCSRSSCARRPRANARLVDGPAESFPEALDYVPAVAEEDAGPRRYLSLLERAAAAVDVPVIASLNGVTPEGWTDYARAMQDAGAAAIELNIYYLPGDPHISGRDVEQRHVDVLQRVKDAVTVPVAVKLSPYFSSTGEMALRLDEAGADALVLFNRFLQPDIDPEELALVAHRRALERRPTARLPRTWIALLRGRVRAALAATGGVEGPADVAKYLLAGADVVMTASALLRHGPEYASVLLDGLSDLDGAQGVRLRRRAARHARRAARRRRGGVRARGLRQRAASSQRPRPRPLVSVKPPALWPHDSRCRLVARRNLCVHGSPTS